MYKRQPKNESIIITPICPHTLFSRSLVLSPDNQIEIQINSKTTEVSLNTDGRKSDVKIMDQDIFKVEKYRHKVNPVSYTHLNITKIFGLKP